MEPNSQHSPQANYLLSTDSLSGFWLDLIFDVAKSAGFDGIDLALWKIFDARNVDYVKKLSANHNLPVRVIQTSASLNAKEMNQALDLCVATGADTIAINAPSFFDFKAYNYISEVIKTLIKENPTIKFSIINPPNSSFMMLPIPQYRYTNPVEIIKQEGAYLALDIVNISEESLEGEFLRKINNFIPHLSTIYLSDKNKQGIWHLIPGEWDLKLVSFLKKLHQNNYQSNISLKITIDKKDLADPEKVTQILKKSKTFFDENFQS